MAHNINQFISFFTLPTALATSININLAPTTTSTAISVVPTTTSAHSSSGLTSDAKIGLGVGLGAGSAVALLTVALFIIYRRKFTRSSATSASATPVSRRSSCNEDPTTTGTTRDIEKSPERGTAMVAAAATAATTTEKKPVIEPPAHVVEADSGPVSELASGVPAAVELPEMIQDKKTELDTPAGVPIGARARAEVLDDGPRYELPA